MTRVNPPDYWVRPFQPLKNEPGMQRFVWDLMYPNPPSDRYDLPISAIYRDTPFVPQGPYVMPGRYTVRLTVNGQTYTQPLVVRMDPRVTTPAAGLLQQYDLSMRAYNGIIESTAMLAEIRKASDRLAAAHAKAGSNAALAREIESIQASIRSLTGAAARAGGPASGSIAEIPLSRLNGSFSSMLDLLQDADVTPTTQAVRDLSMLNADLARITAAWSAIKSTTLPALESKLTAAGISF
jgi:hypothetical protein